MMRAGILNECEFLILYNEMCQPFKDLYNSVTVFPYNEITIRNQILLSNIHKYLIRLLNFPFCSS